MTKQYLVRQPDPELTDDHLGFSQMISLYFEAAENIVSLEGAFFTINWKDRILEGYTEHLGYHGFNLDSISGITIHQMDCLEEDLFVPPDERLLDNIDDAGWILAYCIQVS